MPPPDDAAHESPAHVRAHAADAHASPAHVRAHAADAHENAHAADAHDRDAHANAHAADAHDRDAHASAPVVVALSGGVDSATAAAMVVASGRPAIGITMRLFDARGTSASAGGRCCGPRDIEDARRVCRHLGIPFYVVDFAETFQRRVIDDFVDGYLAGETPNPCVRCNQYIKFTPLLRRARALGATSVVTGHYARLDRGPGGVRLRRGIDPRKDQSYFLFSMPPDELAAVEFPLGALDKDEVRRRARAFGLPNADKPESQEICFVPDGKYADFVEAAALTRAVTPPGEGDIVDRDGQVLGRHRGVHHYTIGQRRGLGGVGGPAPVYVVGIDRARNRVIVGPRADARRGSLRVRAVRWLVPAPDAPAKVLVQVRHRGRPMPATVRPLSTGETDATGETGAMGETAAQVVVELADDAPVAAPGQAAVFYDGDTVLGGGWIG